MSTRQSMARNAAAMMLSQGITWASTLLLIATLPRALGASDYGKLQFAMALTGMFTIFVDFGTATLVTREVARNRDRAPAYLSNTLVLKILTALVACAAVMATVRLMHRPPVVVHLVAIFSAGMVVVTTTNFLNSFLQAFEEIHFQAWGMVIEKVSKTAFVLALLFAGFRLVPVAWALLAGSSLNMLWAAAFVLRRTRPSLRLVSLGAMRDLFSASLPFFLFGVFAKIYDKIDVTMLAMMTSDQVVGWYTAAYRLFETLFFLPYIFSTVAFPVLSRLSATDWEAYRRAVHRGFAILSTAAVGICVSLFLLAGPMVDLLYSGAEYPGTAPALRILALALGCMYLNTIFVTVLITTDRQARWTRAGAVAAVVNPAVNYLPIPQFGHLGAAMTTVITEAMLMALAFRACPPGVIGRPHARVLLRALLAGTLLAAGLLAGRPWGAPASLALGVPLYVIAVLRLGILSPADLSLISDAFRARLGPKK